ncbi:unnamed protein product, partial [marine sediment metagenome]
EDLKNLRAVIVYRVYSSFISKKQRLDYAKPSGRHVLRSDNKLTTASMVVRRNGCPSKADGNT